MIGTHPRKNGLGARGGGRGRETYWRRPDSGHLYPQGAAYNVVLRDQEEYQA
jgi:hypothetical protein